MNDNRQNVQLAVQPADESVEQSIEDAVRSSQNRYQLFPQTAVQTDHVGHVGHRYMVVIGVSGGADSLCLLHVLTHLAAEWCLELHVGHLDHALRPDSAEDAHFVKNLARIWGIPFHSRRLEPGELAAEAGNLETAARHARHRYLAELAQQLTPAGQIPIVVLAHHADDQAETLLHHLVRSSGLQGLAGMRPIVSRPGPSIGASTVRRAVLSAESTTLLSSSIAESNLSVIHLVRPLLYVRRATILQYLRAHVLEWREDSTNEDQRCTRNYLRHTIVPALAQINPAAVEAIARAATLVGEEAARLEAYDRTALATLQLSASHKADERADERFVINLDALQALAWPTQRALLRMAVTTLAPTLRDLSLAHLDALGQALQSAVSGGPHPLLADVMWSVAGATAHAPARLSLHRSYVCPFLPDQPLLDIGQQLALPSVVKKETAHLTIPNGWRLMIRRMARSALPTDWQSRDQPWRAFFDATEVGSPVLTTPICGQQFAPLGMAGQHKAVGDFFTDCKIPIALRNRWPLLIDHDSGDVLWVCGLRMAHRARITDQTEQVLCIRFEPTERGVDNI